MERRVGVRAARHIVPPTPREASVGVAPLLRLFHVQATLLRWSTAPQPLPLERAQHFYLFVVFFFFFGFKTYY